MSETGQVSSSIRRKDAAGLLAVYLAATSLYFALGLRFDASPFPMFMQFLDEDLLRDRFFESIWHYHAFPPLLNAFAASGLKVFGVHADVYYSVCFHAAGFLLAVSVFYLTLQLSGSRWAAHLAALVLVLSPAFALYQNWFMYTFPSTCLLTGAAVALGKFARSWDRRWGLAFFSLVGLLALTRSMFHVAWLVVVVAAVTAVAWGQRRRVIIVAALPLVLVVGWYAKNYLLFGTFSTSSVAGLGLSNITTLTVPADELLPLVKNGTLSPFALVSRYQDLDIIFSSQALAPTGVPALDRKFKISTNRSPLRSAAAPYNFNNLQIVAVNRYYASDGLKAMRLFPYHYVTGLRISNLLFFSPSHMNMYFTQSNREAAWPMERLLNPVLYGVPPRVGTIVQPHWGADRTYSLEINPSVPLMLLWIFLLPYGYLRARRSILSRDPARTADGVVVAFIVGNAAYVYVLGTMLELGENYRYKFMVEPTILVLSVVAITDLLRRLRAAHRGRSQANSDPTDH